ncbi:NAD(P)H-hydrate epimerase [Luteococcus peritonei]|uniref:Bifunctional NAD(P)H-hydrate repair enzyme n=1 Tax=Luteococcus peritonei TaxID=88874 RepID=A0ABW4RS24_9ACTN
MIAVHTAQQVREAEQAFFAANPGVDLMQRAADGLAEAVENFLEGRGPGVDGARLLVAVGPGNNGGDALFAAARLARLGCRVELWATHGDAHEAGLAEAQAAGCQQIDAGQATTALAEADLLLDGVLGIGGRPGLDAPVATLAREARDLGIPVVAVDLPSGLDADSSTPAEESFHATLTVTFGALKPCHVLQPAASRCGEVRLVDIGLELGEPWALAAAPGDIAQRWPLPGPTSDKYSRGVVGIDTGSVHYPGAAVLGTVGALHAGAGMIRFCGPGPADGLIRAALPSVTHGEGRVQAWLVGSGWGDEPGDAERLAGRLADGLPTVVDADALRLLPDHLPAGCLLTPHAGELARLLDVEREEVTADPIGHARAAADRWQAVVLLKGATQYVVQPDGAVWLAVPGPHWSAQAGSGDVLAGICATLLAAGLDAARAALLGASVQAMAARRRPGPYPPDDIAREVPAVVGGFEVVR